jgi:hypothetical protein
MDNEKPQSVNETEALTLLGSSLLKQLEPEIEYVRKLLNEEIKKLLASSEWKGQHEAETPWLWSLERRNYRLKIAIIHARKGEHKTGADLVFELKDRKVLFLQSKRVGSDRRLHFDRLQLKKLADLETEINLGIYPERLPPPWPPYRLLFLKKAAFYHLIMNEPVQMKVQERFFHISEIASVLGSRKSVAQDEFLHGGIEQEKFDEMFWKCKIGGPDLEEETKRSVFEDYSLITNRMLIWFHVELKT